MEQQGAELQNCRVIVGGFFCFCEFWKWVGLSGKKKKKKLKNS